MDSQAPLASSSDQSPDDRLAALLHFSQQLGAERDLPRLLDMMAREVARILAAERASVFIWDRSTDELWSLVALGSEPLRFDARRGIAGTVVHTGSTLNVADPSKTHASILLSMLGLVFVLAICWQCRCATVLGRLPELFKC